VQGLATVHLVMGDDSQFGRSGSGDYKLLESLGRQHAFSVEPTPTFEFAGGRVSSTRIRELLEHGEFAQAEELLGRAYSISGKVIYGRQLGRELGAPTANISLHRIQAAMAGVYAVEARLVNSSQSLLEMPSDWMTGVANVGVRPTVDANVKAILEVHLIDFQGDLYGRQMEVRFLHKIRDEQRFSDVTQLQSQIERDVADTRSWFGAN